MPRLPEYLKRPIIDTEKTKTVRRILKSKCLNTVCEGARCPNKSECYSANTATFLIMGQVCTRNCRYCNISTEKPQPLDLEEPKHVAEAIKELGLKFAVITSVTRDDLPDGGAEHFKNCIEEIRKICDAKIEILTPDFRSKTDSLKPLYNSLDTIISAKPDVFSQYIQPSKQHLPVDKYYTLEEFENLKVLARKIGFKNFQIGPLVRSSYHAKGCYEGREVDG